MKSKRAFLAICTVLLLAAASGTAWAQTCGTPTVVNLIAGQHTVAGTVTVSNTSGILTVTYNTTGGWVLNSTKLAVFDSFAQIPTTRSRNPIPGHFPYKTDHSPAVTTYTYTIDLDGAGFTVGETLYVAAMADVQNGTQTEGAWGQGARFNPTRGNWAMWFTYVVQQCAPQTIQPGDFRTQTQGGWGSECHGNNPGCYRDTNFAGAFPSGLVVGSNYTATFTNSSAIEDFLPQGGTPGALTVSVTDPTSTAAGVLAGQVVALTLNVGFDAYDPNFGASSYSLSALRVVKAGDACEGMYVQGVLDEANIVLGGGSSTFSPSQINDCVSAINENFVDGTFVGDYLGL